MSEVLGALPRLAAMRRRAEDVYRRAVVDAVAELERQGAPDAFSRVARAAGVSRQAVRELVIRSRTPRS